MLREQLLQFLEDPRRSTWLESPELEVYVRKGPRFVGSDEAEMVLTVANVTARPQRRGSFTRFLDMAEEVSPYAMYMEGVGISQVARFLERRGYTEIPRKRIRFLDLGRNMQNDRDYVRRKPQPPRR